MTLEELGYLASESVGEKSFDVAMWGDIIRDAGQRLIDHAMFQEVSDEYVARQVRTIEHSIRRIEKNVLKKAS